MDLEFGGISQYTMQAWEQVVHGTMEGRKPDLISQKSIADTKCRKKMPPYKEYYLPEALALLLEVAEQTWVRGWVGGGLGPGFGVGFGFMGFRPSAPETLSPKALFWRLDRRVPSRLCYLLVGYWAKP